MDLFSKKETLNERIKMLRTKIGLTQKELAEKVHVTDKAVSKWETGDGNPEITILIELASVFDVSIDYLLTGKEKEPEIIYSSKMEASCKNDDVNLFKSINIEALKAKDESNKYITEYLLKYNCPNVYQAFIEVFGASSLISNYTRGSLNFDNEEIIKLMIKYNDITSLRKINFFSHNMTRDQWGTIASLNRGHNYSIYNGQLLEKVLPLITNESIIWSEIFRIHENNLINSVVNWQCVYSNILTFASKEDKKDLLNKLIDLIIKLNNTSIEAYEKARLKEPEHLRKNYHLITGEARIIDNNQIYNRIHYYNYSVVAIPVIVIEKLLEFGNIDIAIILNRFNKLFNVDFIADGIINSEIMKKDGKSSKEDIKVTSCMEFGIVNIDKLLKYNDYKLAKYALENYPISFNEMLESYLNNNKLRELYEFSIDNNFLQISSTILSYYVNKNIDDIKKSIETTSNNIYLNSNQFDVNKKYFVNQSLARYPVYGKPLPRYTSEEVKIKVLNDLKLKLEKEIITKDLTKDYFYSLIESNNVELLIIKLSVKLEAILKFDYKYEGTFEEMLNQYFSRFQSDYNSSTSTNLLNKLRKYRNGIVHPEQSKEELTHDDLKFLIDYICKLG